MLATTKEPDPLPLWKGLTIFFSIVLTIAGLVAGMIWLGYTIGYREGDAEGERRVRQEAVDAGVGEHPKATKFQWKQKP